MNCEIDDSWLELCFKQIIYINHVPKKSFPSFVSRNSKSQAGPTGTIDWCRFGEGLCRSILVGMSLDSRFLGDMFSVYWKPPSLRLPIQVVVMLEYKSRTRLRGCSGLSDLTEVSSRVLSLQFWFSTTFELLFLTKYSLVAPLCPIFR